MVRGELSLVRAELRTVRAELSHWINQNKDLERACSQKDKELTQWRQYEGNVSQTVLSNTNIAYSKLQQSSLNSELCRVLIPRLRYASFEIRA